jgi:phage gp29-like protein
MQRYSYRTALEAYFVVSQIMPNPDLVLQRRGVGIGTYRELLFDSHITAAIESREAATLAYEWEIQKGDSQARLFKGVEYWFHKILEDKLSVDSLDRIEIIDNFLDVIFWGYQPTELTWGYEGGLWVPVEITPKPPEWFQWFVGQDGKPVIHFMDYAHPVNGVPPPNEFALICPRIKPTFDNPYGRGVANRCFWPIVFKRAGIEFWMNFMERFGTPWVKGTMESGNTDDLKRFATDLEGLVQDAVIALPQTKTVELLESKSGSGNIGEAFQMLCDFFDRQMTKTILGHTLATDTSDKAAYAATRGALAVRDDIALSDLRMVTATWNGLVRMIARRNGYNQFEVPSIAPFRQDVIDMDRATRDETLSRAGVRFNKDYFVRAYRFKEDDIQKVVDPKPPPAKLQQAKKPAEEKSTTPGGLKGDPKGGDKNDE